MRYLIIVPADGATTAKDALLTAVALSTVRTVCPGIGGLETAIGTGLGRLWIDVEPGVSGFKGAWQPARINAMAKKRATRLGVARMNPTTQTSQRSDSMPRNYHLTQMLFKHRMHERLASSMARDFPCRMLGGIPNPAMLRVSGMVFMTRKQRYEAYLAGSHWGGLKSLKYREVGKVCQFCKGTKEIQCHHMSYRNLTDCTTADLIVLCKGHHFELHWALGILGLESKDCDLATSLRHIAWVLPIPHNERRRLKRERQGPPTKKKLRKLKRLEREFANPQSPRCIRRKMAKIINDYHHGSKTLSRVKALHERIGAFIAEIDTPPIRLDHIPCGHTAVEGEPLPL